MRRIMHRQNLGQTEEEIAKRHSMDYKMSKMRLKEGESRKKQEKREELLSRQDRYMSLNVSREVGRSRIDKFFKQKNIEYTLSYK